MQRFTVWAILALGAAILCTTVNAQAILNDPKALNEWYDVDDVADTNNDIAVNDAGTWVAVWSTPYDTTGLTGPDNDIVVARSDDGGATWSSPLPVLSGVANFDSESEGACAIATDGANTWIVVWQVALAAPTGAHTIRGARSVDNAQTWTELNYPADTTAFQSEYTRFPQVDTDGVGGWVICWQSNNSIGGTLGTDIDIFSMRSLDNGATWENPVPVNSNAATDYGSYISSGPGRDDTPLVVTDRAGTWLLFWGSDNYVGGGGADHDIAFARSTDTGASWSTVAALNTNAGTDSVYSDYRPAVATDRNGAWVAIWVSDYPHAAGIGSDLDAVFSRSTDNGLTWSAPQILNAANAAGATPCCFTMRAEDLATDGAGYWVGLWTDRNTLGGTLTDDWDTFIVESTDNGLTWSEPRPLLPNAAANTVDDSTPRIAMTGSGYFQVAVCTVDDAFGMDRDILLTASAPWVVESLPAATAATIVALALLLLGAAWMRMHRAPHI